LRKIWSHDPHSGGKPVPKSLQNSIIRRILNHAEKNYSGKYKSIDIRFKGKFCYIDVYTEPYVQESFDSKIYGESREEHLERLRKTPTHLFRLRYFGYDDKWTMAFYAYSHEKYEPCIFNNGKFFGTPEEAFDTSSVYLIE
jgi:hypothetical protein